MSNEDLKEAYEKNLERAVEQNAAAAAERGEAAGAVAGDAVLAAVQLLPQPLQDGLRIGTQVVMALVANEQKHAAFLGRFIVAQLSMSAIEGMASEAESRGEPMTAKELREVYLVNYTATLQAITGVQMPPEFMEAVGRAATIIMEAYEVQVLAHAPAQAPSGDAAVPPEGAGLEEAPPEF